MLIAAARHYAGLRRVCFRYFDAIATMLSPAAYAMLSPCRLIAVAAVARHGAIHDADADGVDDEFSSPVDFDAAAFAAMMPLLLTISFFHIDGR